MGVLGPFDVTPEQIENLKAGFTTFVNLLLEQESRTHEFRGHILSVNVRDTAPDGGVDAGIRGAAATDWIPAGDSAWQFKRGNLLPKACADEFETST